MSFSIRRQIRSSYVIIILLMLLPSVIGIVAFLAQTARYDLIITNVSKTNRVNQIVRTAVSAELWDIVAGNRKFSEGSQYEIIAGIRLNLEEIIETTTLVQNRQLLEVAGRAVNTLEVYVDRLGEQIEERFPVSENERILDEARGVIALVSDILQDFIVLEIESAERTNEKIKQMARLLVFGQLAIVVLVTLFASFAQRSVSVRIGRPIEQLEMLSNRIAAGDLDARADIPHVLELDTLTENLNRMARKISALIEANIREQQNLQKSEMKALQAQITPHFLYNTFDTIIWLAEAREYDQVIALTRSFSSFFRISLNRGKDWVTVAEEFEHIKSYLTIQKIRYRDILDYSIHYDENMMNLPVLKLLLQPIVENALYHGIKNKRGRGNVIVKGWIDETGLCFSVSDNGIGMTLERLQDVRNQICASTDPENLSGVYGLYNVNKRLALYYGDKARLEIDSMYREGTVVTFCVPEVERNV